MKKKADFKSKSVRFYWHTAASAEQTMEYTRESLVNAAVTNPTERNFGEWYLKRFNMGWKDVAPRLDTFTPETEFISYETTVARIYHSKGAVLIDTKRYSVTTAQQTSKLAHAAHEAGMYFTSVPDVFEPTSDRNAEYYLGMFTAHYASLTNTRKRPHNRLYAYSSFDRLHTELVKYMQLFGQFAPEAQAKLAQAAYECRKWADSKDAAVCRAKCALDGKFYD